MKLLITGGGTGGHLSIAKAIKTELNSRGLEPVFVGSTAGQDREWFENDSGWEVCYFLPSSGVVNKRGLQKGAAALNILKLSWQCREIFKKHKIEAVLSVGGYSAAPASLAAITLRTPLFIHEQNAILGRLNRLLQPLSKELFNSFIPPFYPYPTHPDFFAKRRIRKSVETVLFLGGSQGAKQINNIAISLAPLLHKRGIAIIHQTGKQDFERIKQFYEEQNIAAEVFAFDKNIASKMSRADLAIARAGASSLWELAANALPAVFVPYPYAAANHQYYNAKFFVDKGAGYLYNSNEDIIALLDSSVEDVSQKLIQITKPEGAKIIVDRILEAI
ncbi:UDP-N-acetylglucosamine--N-acetylmuramyl-(pentapeptide) pyrophosphoryl-undecaprenol N-acetylglucosamine transferase [Nitratiruptor sp. YY09-18]|uniref:UDP-N-acetylglucosamine--N-acetylmuramyl- (pentapeptide) pyrophosphoryl-undecaprenol N-acetylglucosamine transferase n=1 Tax=Nitratiruptor sp. YY09-18 TaxID=2724901 RepID=UPI001914E513|nr:UDP-N-acetylglucosamine--N-acetylmuramyl-(pentapeptide) pyrophosphoryl-undecaprenol N-acetylglucosamine transferase [Nitratiruptor sp. YY09-18]BCD68635.1 UDP-N-acetylglucosamine--N-acetylmuramyl-(pentapeptide) pyrophosphoryl-undecaprenol N-acetylglucosamine transferase [Nitratiruptor sp. YY09-18]